MKGKISREGYRKNSPDKDNDYNIINSSYISMSGVPHPVLGIDEFGNQQLMTPGNEYKFPGNTVTEFPMKKLKKGGKVDRMSKLSDAEAMYYYMNDIPLPSEPKAMPNLDFRKGFVGGVPEPVINKAVQPKPSKKKSITFEALYDKSGNMTSYSPVFNNYTRHDAIRDGMDILPKQIGDIPVQFSPDTYGELWNNFNPGTTSDQWFQEGGRVDNTGRAPVPVSNKNMFPYGDPRAYGIPASGTIDKYDPKAHEGQVTNPAFNHWADNVFWPTMDIMGAAEIPMGAIKSLPKRVAKSAVSVDDLGMYTAKGNNKYYELGNGFGDIKPQPAARAKQSKPFVVNALKETPEPTDYSYIHKEGEKLYPNQRYSIDPRDYPGPNGKQEAQKDAYDIVGKWLMENKMGQGDRVNALLSSLQYNQMGGPVAPSGPTTGSYTQNSLPYSNWNTQEQWDFGQKPNTKKDTSGQNNYNQANDYEDEKQKKEDKKLEDLQKTPAQKEYEARMYTAGIMGTVGNTTQGFVDAADMMAQFYSGIQNRNNQDKANQMNGYSDNQFYTGQGSDRGDYFNGIYKPDKMGNYSFTGMNNGMYYPKAKLGMEIGEGYPSIANMMPSFAEPSFEVPTANVGKPINNFKEYIKQKESSGDYTALPKKKDGTLASSAVGAYQFIWNSHKKEIKDVTGIGTKEAFRNNPQAQDMFFDHWDKTVLTPTASRIKKQFNLDIPLSRIKEKVHFAGPKGAWDYYAYGKETKDAFGTTTSTYKEGGEVTLSDEEISKLRAQGYDIEILD